MFVSVANICVWVNCGIEGNAVLLTFVVVAQLCCAPASPPLEVEQGRLLGCCVLVLAVSLFGYP